MYTRNWYEGLLANLNPDLAVQCTKHDGSSTTTSQSYLQIHRKTSSPWGCYLGSIGSAYGVGTVLFGTGTTPPTVDDYALSGDVISTLVGTVDHSESYDNTERAVTEVYTLTNTGDAAVTIGEVGIFTSAGSSSKCIMLERTVLESPITIEPGGVGQVTYTLRGTFPIA